MPRLSLTRDSFSLRHESLGHAKPLDYWQSRRETKANIGWMWKDTDKRPGPNVSHTFNDIYAQAARGQDVLPADAKQFTYVLIPGFISNKVPGYMEPNAEALRAAGLNVVLAPVIGTNDIRSNEVVVAKLIAELGAQGKKIVILGHSAGGLNALDALAEHPELKKYVHTVAAMQSPYLGNPIASDVTQTAAKGPVTKVFQATLSVDPKSIEHMTYKSRKTFVTENPYPQDVPTLTLSSGYTGYRSFFTPADGYMRLSYGLSSDGMVSEIDSRVPGAPYVHLDGNDHMSTVSNWPIFPGKYKTAPLTYAVVRMALDLARERAAASAPPKKPLRNGLVFLKPPARTSP